MKKSCNDDRNNFMMQLGQISHIVISLSRLAGQGGVLEGVADKPFFFTSSSQSLGFYAMQVK